jgi:hypothetical protein
MSTEREMARFLSVEINFNKRRKQTMKKTGVILTMAGIICIAAAGSASAGTSDPVIDQRQINQERRIDQGVNSGQLTPAEAGRLEAQQARIEQREERMKNDGNLTERERRALTRQQNRAGRNIYRKKHNLRRADVL